MSEAKHLYAVVIVMIAANFLTCGSSRHSLVLGGRCLPRLVHIDVVHR